MNKSELINEISRLSKLSQADSQRALNATVFAISDVLSRADSVQLTGFGSFVVRQRVARLGRNPQTGSTIQIEASTVVAFKAAKALKETINKQH